MSSSNKDLKLLQDTLKTRHIVDSHSVLVDGATKNASSKTNTFVSDLRKMVNATSHDVVLSVLVVK